MLVSDIINAVSGDIRQVISPTDGAALYISWTDRVHKECLHSSCYSYLNQAVESISLVNGTSTYTLGTIPRKIIGVYDRTFDRPIRDMDDQQAMQAGGPPPGSITNSQWVEYFKRIGTNSFIVFPAPQKTVENATVEVYYAGYVADLTATTSPLIIPSDGIDLVTAGVNFYASYYLKNAGDMQFWASRYEALKA